MKKLLLPIMLLMSAGVFARGLEVSAPQLTEHFGSVFTVPISVDNTEGVIAYQFHLSYNPMFLSPSGDNYGCSTEGTLAESFAVSCFVASTGTLNVAVYGTIPLEAGAGPVLNITFRSVKRMPMAMPQSPLALSEIAFYDLAGCDGDPIPVTQVDGSVRFFW